MVICLTVTHLSQLSNRKLRIGAFRGCWESGPQNSVFHFLEPFVSGAAARFHSKKIVYFHFWGNGKKFLWFCNFFKGNSLNSRFRKHLLGLMEPPQNKNERYFSRVFQLFVGAKPNSCFLGRKNFVVGKRLTRKLTFPSKVCLFGEKGCLFE